MASTNEKELHEYRTVKDTYIGLSVNENERLRKLTLRLSSNVTRKLDFIRSNTFDFVSFGFCNLRQGGLVGLPPSYFATSTDDLASYFPGHTFNMLGKQVRVADLNAKLDARERDELMRALVLSDDAKLFGLMRQFVATDKAILSNLDKAFDLVFLMGAYTFAYVRSRAKKMQLRQRRTLYIITTLVTLGIIHGSHILLQKHKDRVFETDTCQLGLDCCEGSIEYYEKLIERNKILRKLLPDGEKLIDADGNYLYRAIRVPFTSYFVYMPNYGLTFTERKKLCQSELFKSVTKLLEQQQQATIETAAAANSVHSENSPATNIPKKDEDKEWEIFRKIRLFLENTKGRS